MTIQFTLNDTDNVLIKKGDNVDLSTPLQIKQETKLIRINVAHTLKISPKKIFMHLNKVVGDTIHKGDIIAEKKSLLKNRYYVSEVDGVIKEISHEDGSIALETKDNRDDNDEYFFMGMIQDIANNVITLKVEKETHYPIKQANSTFGGEIYFVKEEDLPKLKEENVNDKVLFLPSITSYDASKLEVMGADGFVTIESLPEDVTFNAAWMASKTIFQELAKEHFKYCIIDKKSNTIYSYE